jgi:hypothetical protein
MGWRPGDSFRALSTQSVKRAGIVPGSGGEITSILGAKVSFVVERGGPGAGSIQAHSSLNEFSENFAHDKAKETARRSFQDARIYPKEFPKDFVK